MSITLSQHLNTSSIHPELSAVLALISSCCQQISTQLKHGALADILGNAGSGNIQGEDQKKLDVIANDLLTQTLLANAYIAAVASEEMDDIELGSADGKYIVLFDPLDGSSNIDINMAVGTIFSIVAYQAGEPFTLDLVRKQALQMGTAQLAAGYALYGPSTQLVLTTGNGVSGFTLDVQRSEFILTTPSYHIPTETREFAINSSNSRHWEAPVKRYIDECLAGKTGPRAKDFNMRWVACMVGDIHRILTRGGIFMYPYDTKDPSKAGRLRLMYEANPMGMLIEQADGLASTGRESILTLNPRELHQRVPVIMGARHEVERLFEYHRHA